MLAAGLDFWDSYMSYSAQKFQRYFGFCRSSTIYQNVSKLLSVGDIEKIVKKDKVYLRLTSQGNHKITQDVSLFKYEQQPWDGYWRMVIFDIPEKNKSLRNTLRQKLVSLGFGQWQKSIYITPFPLEEEVNQFLKSQKLWGHCFCIKGQRLGKGDDQKIAEYVFKLEKLYDEYCQFIEDGLYRAQTFLKENKLQQQHIQALVEQYLKIILKDPGLPKELLPSYWRANEAKKEFNKFIIALEKQQK